MSNLIIIGNGFDLQCGLKTKYSDFFEFRKKKIKESIDLIDDVIQLKSEIQPSTIYNLVVNNSKLLSEKLTFWDWVFLYYYKKNPRKDYFWFDIEEIIFAIVNSKDNSSNKDINLGNIANEYEMIDRITNGIRLRNNFDVTNFNQVLSILFFYRNSQKSIGKTYLTCKIDLYDFALQELIEFEKSFVEYMLIIKKDSSYYSTSHRILKYLNESKGSYSLLNFNYTNPTLYFRDNEKENLICTENVHGDISNKNIIFGIDHSSIDGISLSYQFTKTARKIYSKNDTIKIIGNKLLPKDLERITIYGHSLNSADFSYYQSIFDFYDLYHSEISLVFYFSNYSKENIMKLHKVNYNRVIQLILEYGKSMDNKNHGKNLLHKLLLEDRLQIRIIENDFLRSKQKKSSILE